MINSQIIRFLITGFVNTLFYYCLFSFFIYIQLDYKIAVLLATSIGGFFSFKTFGKYVFDDDSSRLITLFKFILSYIVLYFIHIYIISLLLFLNTYLAGLLALMPMVVLTYIFNNYFVFAKK